MSQTIVSVFPQYEPTYNIVINDNLIIGSIHRINNLWTIHNWQDYPMPDTDQHEHVEDAISDIIQLLRKYPRLYKKQPTGNPPTIDQIFGKNWRIKLRHSGSKTT